MEFSKDRDYIAADGLVAGKFSSEVRLLVADLGQTSRVLN